MELDQWEDGCATKVSPSNCVLLTSVEFALEESLQASLQIARRSDTPLVTATEVSKHAHAPADATSHGMGAFFCVLKDQ